MSMLKVKKEESEDIEMESESESEDGSIRLSQSSRFRLPVSHGTKDEDEDEKTPNSLPTPRRRRADVASPMSAPVQRLGTHERLNMMIDSLPTTTPSALINAVKVVLPSSSSNNMTLTSKPAFHIDPAIAALAHISKAIPYLLTNVDHKASDIQKKEMVEKIHKNCDSSFDDSLLWEHGKRPSPLNPALMIDTPPCIYGAQCGVMTGCLTGMDETKGPRGFIMGTYMSQDVCREHFMKGTQPERTACLYCLRALAMVFTKNMKADGNEDAIPDTVCIQRFTNGKVDRPGGYKKECCTLPSAKGWNGIALPLAAARKSDYVARLDKRSGKYYLDQSKMKYVVPVTRPTSLNSKGNF